MSRDPIRVLFVCTGNSARSIMAEALLRRHGGDRFEVHSAGTEPRGVNPLTLRVLADAGIDASWARSKSVDEFLGQRFDYVSPSATRRARSARSSLASTSRCTGATRIRPRRPVPRRSAWPCSDASSSRWVSGSNSSLRSRRAQPPRAPPPADAPSPSASCGRRRSPGVAGPGLDPSAQRQRQTSVEATRRSLVGGRVQDGPDRHLAQDPG